MSFSHKIASLLFGCGMAFISACTLIDPAEPKPAYLFIPTIHLTTDYPTQGSNSNEITDAWIYVNDNLVGVFEVPATIPILARGVNKVEIRGGIRKNGQGDTRVPYPFYTSYVKYPDLQPGVTDTLGPITITYRANVKYEFIEGFDEPSTRFEKKKNYTLQDTFYRVTDPLLTYGGSGGSGLMSLGHDTALLQINSVNNYELPGAGADLYLELDYRTNYEFTAGFITDDYKQVSILTLYPDTAWRKAYISFSEDVGIEQDGTKFTIFLGSAKNYTGYGKIYIDNLKLVHLE